MDTPRQFPRTSAILVALLSFGTLGVYAAHWLHTRSAIASLIAPAQCKRLPRWLTALHRAAAAVMAALLLLRFSTWSARLPYPWGELATRIEEPIYWLESITYLVLSLGFRDVLRGVHHTGRRSALNPSMALSIALGPLYYQWLINRRDYEAAAGRAREGASRPSVAETGGPR